MSVLLVPTSMSKLDGLWVVDHSFFYNPILSNKVTVTVNVLDVNEFPPELTIPFDTFVCENAKVYQVIQTINATDKDLPTVGQKFFFKSPREIRNRNFTVRDFGSKPCFFFFLQRNKGKDKREQEMERM